jgi:hypothetical protein
MSSDRLVTPDHLLKAVMEYERRGSKRLLPELEKLEPDLVEYLLESLTRLYHSLGLCGTDARKAYRQAEKTAVVCILALRKAHHDLWRTDHCEADHSGADQPPLEGPPPQP